MPEARVAPCRCRHGDDSGSCPTAQGSSAVTEEPMQRVLPLEPPANQQVSSTEIQGVSCDCAGQMAQAAAAGWRCHPPPRRWTGGAIPRHGAGLAAPS